MGLTVAGANGKGAVPYGRPGGRVRRVLRKAALHGLYGGYLVARPARHWSEVAVLTYHSISDSGWFYAVCPSAFERQMRHLRSHGCPVRLAEVADYVAGQRELPPQAVAVTFDDGYRDFLTEAFPILERYEIPATLFVCTGEVDREELDNDLPLLDWTQIAGLAKSGVVEVGSHGVTHRKLTTLPRADAEREVVESRGCLEERLGKAPDFFAYPSGLFDEVTCEIVRDAGYRGAFSGVERLVKTAAASATARYAVPRIEVNSSVSLLELRARITAATDWYGKAVDGLRWSVDGVRTLVSRR